MNEKTQYLFDDANENLRRSEDDEIEYYIQDRIQLIARNREAFENSLKHMRSIENMERDELLKLARSSCIIQATVANITGR